MGGNLTTFLVSLAAILVAVTAQCDSSCEFSFCDGISSFEIGPGFSQEDVAFTGAICKDGLEVGHIDSTGEALVSDGTSRTPISMFSPEGLLQSFSPSTFKSFSVFTSEFEASGVGHECPQTNGYRFLDGLCIVLPITAYQELNEFGQVLENYAPSSATSCIAFDISVPNANVNPVVLTEVPMPTNIPITPTNLGICQMCSADSECEVDICESFGSDSVRYCGAMASQVAAGCLDPDGGAPVNPTGPSSAPSTSAPGGGVSGGSSGGVCDMCESDDDCAGGICGMFNGGVSYCGDRSEQIREGCFTPEARPVDAPSPGALSCGACEVDADCEDNQCSSFNGGEMFCGSREVQIDNSCFGGSESPSPSPTEV